MATRREFVAGTAAVLGVSLLPRSLAQAQPWCAAPGAPGIDAIERIGVQLYTVRSEMQKDVAATVARVAQIGFREVEFAGYFQLEPARVRALLDQHGLTSPSVHLAIEALERDFATHAATAKVIGHRTLIVPSLNTRVLTTLEAWKGIAARFNALGAKARDAGLRFAFHNHANEVMPLEGTRPYDVLLGETDPALVDYQMDIYWMTRAGGDAAAYFNAHPGRFTSVHVKDATPAPEYGMREVGGGSIDWKALFALHKKAGIRHYFVEHDNPGPDPFASITASHAYLAKLTF